MISEMVPALKIFLALTFLTGIAYPLAITGVAQSLFHFQANGSMVKSGDRLVGSSLIGQEFKEPRFFHGRPSAIGYNPMPSGGTNLGPTSADLWKAIQERRTSGDVDDLLFSSASGLDPEISENAALSQLARIVRENDLSEASVRELIAKRVLTPTLGLLGPSRVNVLLLNMDLLDAVPVKR
jgi:K+-transporting ATPase ATPase C chain